MLLEVDLCKVYSPEIVALAMVAGDGRALHLSRASTLLRDNPDVEIPGVCSRSQKDLSISPNAGRNWHQGFRREFALKKYTNT
jgi:hypothetical protein